MAPRTLKDIEELARGTRANAAPPDPAQTVSPQIRERVRSFYGNFAADLPAGATQRGQYSPVDGDRLLDVIVDVPDGTYRVIGTDWVLTFRQQRLVSAVLARPPTYGGKRVTEV